MTETAAENNNEKKGEQDLEMHWTDHLGELRKRIIWTLLVWTVGLIIGFWFAGDIIHWIKRTVPDSDMSWNAFSPWDGVGLYMKCAIIVSFGLLIPFGVYQFWAFVRPGLQKHEQKATLRYVPFTVLLFAAGLLFAYYVVFPLALGFTSTVTRALGLQETYGIMHYVDFLLNIVFPVAILFELPVLVMFLTRLRILNPMRLRKMRRVAYLVLVFIATLVTPPDLISDLLVTVPLIGLYEASVWMSSLVYRKQLKEQEAAEAEEAAAV